MINFIKWLFSKQPSPKKSSPKKRFVAKVVKVKMCQLMAHVGTQSYKFGRSYQFFGDPLTSTDSYRGDVYVNLTIIPYHKVDRVEAIIWEEDRTVLQEINEGVEIA